MQAQLEAACYLTKGGYQVGTFDYPTYRAIQHFQSRFGGYSDGFGVYGPATAAALQQNPHGRC